ncbi:MAG: hypothetical protein ACOCY8_01095 [Spirochaetota bacterium]
MIEDRFEAQGTGVRGLAAAAGIAALMVVVLTLAEVVAFALAPQPATAAEWFRVFTNDPFAGIVSFWGLELPMYAAFVVVFLGLFVELRLHGPARTAIALLFVGIGAAVFFATNNPFTMLSLATRYEAAADAGSRELFLAAGEAVIAGTGQRAMGGFNVGLLLVNVGGLLIASCMTRHAAFGRGLATLGYLAFGFSLLDFVRQFVTSSAIAALLVIMPGALLLMVWFSFVGVRFLRGRRR